MVASGILSGVKKPLKDLTKWIDKLEEILEKSVREMDDETKEHNRIDTGC